MGRPPKDKADNLPRYFYRKESGVIGFFWWDTSGKRRAASSGETDIEKAKLVREGVLTKVHSLLTKGLKEDSSAWQYATHFVNGLAKNKGAARFHKYNFKHAEALLRAHRLQDIRRPHVKAWMGELLEKMDAGELAPRTILHAYGSLRLMFNEAVADGAIAANPCTLRAKASSSGRRELPLLEDRDPEWRDGAVFTREEVVSLISDPRILHVRRVAYALNFLTGMRGGESVNRRWRDYDATMEPLGQLRLATAWSQENKLEKLPKNRMGRKVPVHPVLAAILAEWKLSGWAKEYGRAPTPEDFIIARPWPRNRQGERMETAPKGWTAGQRADPYAVWVWLNGQWRAGGKRTPGDLQLLGLRPRRTHDTRRTFISLCIEDGANETILKHITHGRPKGAAFDLYPSFTWEKSCEEIKKLRLSWQRKAEHGKH
jgi:integrase